MAHEHGVLDNDKHFSIDPITREITNESGKIVIINHDHNSERFSFSILREVEKHDMSLCNVVRVHYINIEDETKTEYEDAYDVDDLQISAEDENKVVFSWLISRNATQYVGPLSFAIRFACVADDGTEEYGWSTAIHSGIIISEGILNDESVIAAHSDILEQWYKKLELATVEKSIGDFDMLGYGIKNVASPVEESDAANKKYVDEKATDKVDKFDLLWTNGSPGNGWGATPITLTTMNNYSWLMIVFRSHKSAAYYQRSFLPVTLRADSTEGRLRMETIEGGGYYRHASITETGVNFTLPAKVSDASTTSNEYCTPFQIYGCNLT